MSLSVSQDSRRLLTASSDETCKLWDVQTGKILLDMTFPLPVKCVEFDGYSDRACLIMIDQRGAQNSQLRIYNLQENKQEQTALQVIDLGKSRATCARWGPLNETVIVCYEDGVVA